MVIKSKRVRRRYVAFSFNEDSERGGLIALLNATAKGYGIPSPRLIQFQSGFGIVRCDLPHLEATVDMLNSIDGLRTLKTSGTLHKLRDTYAKLLME